MTQAAIGTHGIAGKCLPDRAWPSQETFSLGVFEWLPTKDGHATKRGKVKVRIVGSVSHPEAVKRKATEIAAQLDAGTYAGPKTVRV